MFISLLARRFSMEKHTPCGPVRTQRMEVRLRPLDFFNLVFQVGQYRPHVAASAPETLPLEPWKRICTTLIGRDSPPTEQTFHNVPLAQHAPDPDDVRCKGEKHHFFSNKDATLGNQNPRKHMLAALAPSGRRV